MLSPWQRHGRTQLQEATDRVKYAENDVTNCIPYIPRYIPVLKCTRVEDTYGHVYEMCTQIDGRKSLQNYRKLCGHVMSFVD